METRMDARRLIRGQLMAGESIMLGMLPGISGQSFFLRLPGQGESINWVMGHLSVNEDYFGHLLNDVALRLPERWHKMYREDNSPPIATASAAPTEELIAAFKATRRRTLDALEGADTGRFCDPAPAGLPALFPTRGDVWGLVATHPFWHIGHLATIRAALGL